MSNSSVTWDDSNGISVASLLAKFRIPKIDKQTGINSPRIHLRLYSTIMRAYGLDEAQLIVLFPLSLSGTTHHWYTSFDSSYRRTWKDLAQEFLQHFAFNTGVDVQVINRPTEREQI